MPSQGNLSVPWLDCSGPRFDPAWDAFYHAAVAGGEIVHLHADVLPLVPRAEELLGRVSLYRRVIVGEANSSELEGYCHLGLVALNYLKAMSLQEEKRVSEAFKEFAQTRHMLREPLGIPLPFTFLESSRWGAIVDTSEMDRLAAKYTGQQLIRGTPPALAAPQFCPPPPQFDLANESAVADSLRLVAISTHVCVVEPVASLREAMLSNHRINLKVEFLGTMHPSGRAPCQLVPTGTTCRPGLTAVQEILHDLGDMNSIAYREDGFLAKLKDGLGYIVRKHVARRADAVVCAHPFLLCALLRSLTNLFLLIYLSPSPLAFVTGSDAAWVLGQMRVIAERSDSKLLAASAIYALHSRFQAGVSLDHVWPSSLHIAKRYRWRGAGGGSDMGTAVYVWGVSGVSSDFSVMIARFLWNGRRAGVDWLQDVTFIMRDLYQSPGHHASWDFLETVRCVALLPWDLQLTVFPELYALAAPLALPSPEFFASYAVQALRVHGRMFWSINPVLAGQIHGPWQHQFALEPWIRHGGAELGSGGDTLEAEGPRNVEPLSQFLYWYRASDFELFGHTLRFSSVPDLLRVSAKTSLSELAEVSAAMLREWTAAHRRSACTYARVADALLANTQPKS